MQVETEALDLTLWDIQDGLRFAVSQFEDAQARLAEALANQSQSVIDLRADAEHELQQAEAALTAYLQQEVRKVDGIAGYIRHCEAMAVLARAERDRLNDKVALWDSRRDRLKSMTLGIMQHFDVPKYETALSRLRRQKNGGVVAPVIEDPSLVPDQFVRVTVQLRLAQWKALCASVGVDAVEYSMKDSEFMYADIRKALERGEGVPGARAGERGEHLRVE